MIVSKAESAGIKAHKSTLPENTVHALSINNGRVYYKSPDGGDVTAFSGVNYYSNLEGPGADSGRRF